MYTKLLIRPEGFRLLGVFLTDTDKTALGCPLTRAFQAQFGPYGFHGFDEMFAEFTHVAWCGCDAEAFLADGDSGVVDG